MYKEKIIFKIIKEIYISTKNKTFINLHNKNMYRKIKRKKNIYKNASLAIVNFKNFKIHELVKLFFYLMRNFKIYKNFMIFFDFRREITAYSIIPDWPGEYKFLGLTKNLFFWFKQFALIIRNFQSINYIVIKFK